MVIGQVQKQIIITNMILTVMVILDVSMDIYVLMLVLRVPNK